MSLFLTVVSRGVIRMHRDGLPAPCFRRGDLRLIMCVSAGLPVLFRKVASR